MKKTLAAILVCVPFLLVGVEVSAGSDSQKDKVVQEKEAKQAEKDLKAAAKHAEKEKIAAEKAAAKAAKIAAAKAAAKAKRQAEKEAKKAGKKPSNAHSVPEIDAAGAALALGLLGGIVAVRRERKKIAAKISA